MVSAHCRARLFEGGAIIRHVLRYRDRSRTATTHGACLLQCPDYLATVRSTLWIADAEIAHPQLRHARCQLRGAAEQIELLDRYRQLLWEWNEKMNLTRHTTIEKFVTRDVVDSHQVRQAPWSTGERVLDVGTGGGVPGSILAIVAAGSDVSLCESTQKKARAVEAMVAELGLPSPSFPPAGRKKCWRSAHSIRSLRAAGIADEDSHLVQAALGSLRPAAAGKGAGVGRRAGRGAASQPVARPGTAQGGHLPNSADRRRKRHPQYSANDGDDSAAQRSRVKNCGAVSRRNCGIA